MECFTGLTAMIITGLLEVDFIRQPEAYAYAD
jgi:hypothetical protein